MTRRSFSVSKLEKVKVQLEQDLHLTAKWCLQNKLLINPSKTKYLNVCMGQMLHDMSFSFLGEIIKPVSTATIRIWKSL